MANKRVQAPFLVILVLLSFGLVNCGGGGTPPLPCQGATCGSSASTFLYLTALDDISGFSVGVSGIPTLLKSQAGPNQSIGIAANSSGKFLYISDFTNDLVHAFSIDPATGTLQEVSGSPFSAGPGQVPGDSGFAGIGGIAIDPNTKFLYVTRANSSDVAGFSINSTTGALMPITGSPFAAGDFPMQAIVDSSGKFLYVSNHNDSQGTISAYSIEPFSGALTPVPGSPFPTQAGYPGPGALTIAGGGKYLYVAMVGTADVNHFVSAFSIDSATGVLSQLTGSPFSTGRGPIRVSSDPSGKFLFTADSADDTVSVFTVDPNSGNLTAVAGSPFGNVSTPIDVAVDPRGKFLYVANWGSASVSVFSVDGTTGLLTPLSESPVSIGPQQQPGGLAIVSTQAN
jgi:6-phosphogluconolactonase (cycloisomerase 2 family)